MRTTFSSWTSFLSPTSRKLQLQVWSAVLLQLTQLFESLCFGLGQGGVQRQPLTCGRSCRVARVLDCCRSDWPQRPHWRRRRRRFRSARRPGMGCAHPLWSQCICLHPRCHCPPTNGAHRGRAGVSAEPVRESGVIVTWLDAVVGAPQRGCQWASLWRGRTSLQMRLHCDTNEKA